MFYLNMKNTVKNAKVTTKSGKQKKAPTAKNGFHYITRTAHFSKHKENEKVEFVLSGNMPDWAQKNPAKFWASADQHEIERGRTSTSLTIALPNNLSPYQRQKLALDLIQEIAGEHSFPFTCAIHTHKSEIDGTEQPHLHLMISERSTNFDDVYRTPEQFFKQYRPKNPNAGGAKKLTADALGFGRNYVEHMRELSETLINKHLAEYAPTKKIDIDGIELEVPSFFNRLSNSEYNKKFNTKLEDVPQIPRWKLRSSDPITRLEVEAQKQTIKAIRERNNKQIYSEYYDAEIQKRQKLTSEAAATDQKPQISAVSESFRFSDKLDVERLERIVSFDEKLLRVMQSVRDFADYESTQNIKAQDVRYGYSQNADNKVFVFNVADASETRLNERFKHNYTDYCANVLNALETHYDAKLNVFKESFSLNISDFDLKSVLAYHEQHQKILSQILEPIKSFSMQTKNEVFLSHLDSLKNKESLINSVLEQAQQYKSSHKKEAVQTAQNQPSRDNQNRFDY
ncbi:MobA/MobL family protein [Acinetobacter towneri]|uniref:MobA/MobL family protein n=1 Tax=Acinetobacter towneri TaxID=202956 RepID=UPI001CE1508C|nr:MobA/MobL family protein [Acinetobacter towneri]MCA4791188.1 MobA/MobL family protein [Acinetobacter towneri]